MSQWARTWSKFKLIMLASKSFPLIAIHYKAQHSLGHCPERHPPSALWNNPSKRQHVSACSGFQCSHPLLSWLATSLHLQETALSVHCLKLLHILENITFIPVSMSSCWLKVSLVYQEPKFTWADLGNCYGWIGKVPSKCLYGERPAPPPMKAIGTWGFALHQWADALVNP